MTATSVGISQTRWLAWLFLLAGMLATVLAYERMDYLVRQEVASQLDMRVSEARHTVERQVNAYTEVLRGLQSQFVADAKMSDGRFRKAVDSLRLDSRLPGIQAVGYSQRAERTNDGGQAEAILPAAEAVSTPRFIVQYIEPLEKTAAASVSTMSATRAGAAPLKRRGTVASWPPAGGCGCSWSRATSTAWYFFCRFTEAATCRRRWRRAAS